MVLEELGGRLTAAIRGLGSSGPIDEAAFNEALKEITNALLHADMELALVMRVRANIQKRVNLKELAAGMDRRAVIERAVRDELCALLDGSGTNVPPKPKRNRPYKVMFVGLQGNGKTTTCMKYAYYWKKKGFKPAMVCADTFRAGAYDQLKQNATRCGVPYYGSYEATDPAEVAEAGVKVMEQAKRDVIIVDTSGRHAQSAALFEEMREVAARVQPDATIFVMDGATGQSAGDQARAFAENVDVGGVIITKMDGAAKGGSTLSAVAAARAPVLFIGTGEHMDAFEEFETSAFVSRLLGKGDVKGLARKINEAMPEAKQAELMEQMTKTGMTLRMFRTLLEQMGSIGPLSSILSMLPAMGNVGLGAGADAETQRKFRRFNTMMDSMTDGELDERDARKLLREAKIRRVALGSGASLVEVVEMLNHFKMMTASTSKLTQASKRMDPRNMQGAMAQMQHALPPHVQRQLAQAGGMQGMQEMMKAMGGMPGMKM